MPVSVGITENHHIYTIPIIYEKQTGNLQFFCYAQLSGEKTVKNAVFVQYVTDVQVRADEKEGVNLLLVQVRGFSDHAMPGIPFLIQNPEGEIPSGDMIGFDFVIYPLDEVSKEHHLEWEVTKVFNLDDLKKKPIAVKIKAANNADIAMVEAA